jgi:hypothetical protein
MVQALPPDAPNHALRIRILPRTPRRGQHLIDSQALDAPLKQLAIHRIAIPEELVRSGLPRKGLDELLRDPPDRWVFGDVEMKDSAPPVRQHYQDEEDLGPDRRHGKEIEGDELRHMVLQEGPAGGQGRASRAHAIPRRRGFRHGNP